MLDDLPTFISLRSRSRWNDFTVVVLTRSIALFALDALLRGRLSLALQLDGIMHWMVRARARGCVDGLVDLDGLIWCVWIARDPSGYDAGRVVAQCDGEEEWSWHDSGI